MSKSDGLGLVERARALQPLIAREADEIERTRRLTPAVTAALIENELYRALLPRSVGGHEVPLETFMQMQEEIAKADASTAWCLGQCSVCAMTAAYLEPDAANEIFNTPPGILAWGAINHEVKVVPGGVMANARWEFASGSRQASWLGAHVKIVEADGSVRKKKDGAPEIRTVLFPIGSATMYDVWDTIGLQRHRHRCLFGREPVHPREIRGAARRHERGARKGPALQAHHQRRVQHGLCRDLGRRRARHARCRDRSGALQDSARPGRDARQQCRAGRDRPRRGELARGARLSLRDRDRSLARPRARRADHRGAPHRDPHRRDLDHPSVRLPWSTPPITCPARPRYSPRIRSSGVFATCTRSRSRSRPATPIMKMPARRSCRPISRSRRRRDEEAGRQGSLQITPACVELNSRR